MADFDQYCIAVAAILAALSLRQFRLINFIMFVNFALFYIASYYILEALNGKPAMILHAVYVLISGLTVGLLVELKASLALYVTTFLFSLYNLSIVGEYTYFGSVGFFDNFKVVAHSQMIIELLVMFITGVGGLYVYRGLRPKSDYIRTIDRFFRIGPRLGIEGLS